MNSTTGHLPFLQTFLNNHQNPKICWFWEFSGIRKKIPLKRVLQIFPLPLPLWTRKYLQISSTRRDTINEHFPPFQNINQGHNWQVLLFLIFYYQEFHTTTLFFLKNNKVQWEIAIDTNFHFPAFSLKSTLAGETAKIGESEQMLNNFCSNNLVENFKLCLNLLPLVWNEYLGLIHDVTLLREGVGFMDDPNYAKKLNFENF